ncbi:hypothetical protein [Niabella aurantiaca]|uniref:hypothetical protein n=1 Tax=Niabella aurantiaca TaxID=379900 RepID=UPI00146C2D44|nr:hypothetical protein [Niabella aurantiaca]
MDHLCATFHYNVQAAPTVIFAVRGCMAVGGAQAGWHFGGEYTCFHAQAVPVNYTTARCTIGLWNRTAGRITAFPGSTLPSLTYLAAHPLKQATFNILCPGFYELRKGLHPRSGGAGAHNALLMDSHGIVEVPAIITRNKQVRFAKTPKNYRVVLPGDNLHAARNEPAPGGTGSDMLTLDYSSSGCITICGKPKELVTGAHTHVTWNYWQRFMDSISSSGNLFPFLLFNASEVQHMPRAAQGLLRYGSSGKQVRRLQTALTRITDSKTGMPYYSSAINDQFTNATVQSFFRFYKDISGQHAGYTLKPDQLFGSIRHFKIEENLNQLNN